jgi:hypothetical protein
MISIYRALFLLSLVLFVASLVLPASHGIPIGKRLLAHPDAWSFTFNTSDRRLMGTTEEETKQQLLSYLGDRRGDEGAPLSAFTAPAFVAALLSAVGWRRERDLRRRTSQMQ